MKRMLVIMVTLVLCITMLVSSVVVFAEEEQKSQGVWKDESDFLFTNRYDSTIVNLGNEIFSIGGQGSPGNNNHTMSYNTATGKWKPPLQFDTYNTLFYSPYLIHSGAAVNDKLYIFGGHAGGGPARTVSIYDIKQNKVLKGTDLPTPRLAICASVVGDKIYAIGGRIKERDGIVGTVEIYNTETNTWSTGKSMPKMLDSLISTVVGTKIYVLGDISRGQNMMLIYDTVTNTWEDAPGGDKLSKVSEAALCTVGDKIYILGGVNEKNQPQDAVKIYDTVSGQITQGPKLPETRAGGFACFIEDSIYLAGSGYFADNTWHANIKSLRIPRQPESPKIATVINVDQTMQLSPIEDGNITWSSSDTSIATVDESGKITALEKGLVYINANNAGGTIDQSIAVKVIGEKPVEKNLAVTNVKWTDAGAVVTATGDKKIVMYGVSATKDPAVGTWKSSNVFANVKVGATYYFFAKDEDGNISEPFAFQREE